VAADRRLKRRLFINANRAQLLYSVDEDDDQLFTFVTYLVAAIGACCLVRAARYGGAAQGRYAVSQSGGTTPTDLAQMSQAPGSG
jgi:hypothetical protein